MAFQQSTYGLRELALFAGAGGGILGGHLLGWRTVCAVERDAYAAGILAQRQNDGCLPPFPIWSDVTTFDGRPWRGLIDVVSGGFPCQDISVAGKGAGLDGERSGLWREFARVVREVRPRYVFVENSPMLTGRGLGVVLGDLAALGFDAEWQVLSAADCGAPHLRERIWIVANAHGSERRPELVACDGLARQVGISQWEKGASRAGSGSQAVADTNSIRQLQPEGHEQIERRRAGNSGEEMAYAYRQRQRQQGIITRSPDAQERSGSQQRSPGSCSDGFGWWLAEPDVGRVANGVSARVDRLKALGNAQVPRVAATAFDELAQ